MAEAFRTTDSVSPEFLDALHTALANGQRRGILRHLVTSGVAVPEETLARKIATSDDAVGETGVGLQHVHLPLLADVGLIDWNQDAGVVSLASPLEDLVTAVPVCVALLEALREA